MENIRSLCVCACVSVCARKGWGCVVVVILNLCFIVRATRYVEFNTTNLLGAKRQQTTLDVVDFVPTSKRSIPSTHIINFIALNKRSGIYVGFSETHSLTHMPTHTPLSHDENLSSFFCLGHIKVCMITFHYQGLGASSFTKRWSTVIIIIVTTTSICRKVASFRRQGSVKYMQRCWQLYFNVALSTRRPLLYAASFALFSFLATSTKEDFYYLK